MSTEASDDDTLKAATVFVRDTDGKSETACHFEHCIVSRSLPGMLRVVHDNESKEDWFALGTVLRVEIVR